MNYLNALGVVVNSNGKIKSLHWRVISKLKPKKEMDEEETNNKIQQLSFTN